MTTSTSNQMYIVAIMLFSMAILAIIIFLVIGESDALFVALCSVSGALLILSYRAKVWEEKKVIELQFNSYFLLAIIFLVALEGISIYLFVYLDGDNFLSKIDFFNKWGKYFTLLIPSWIITLLLNLKS